MPDKETDVETLIEARWSAVMARDHLADGRFVYAVRTTGIFCRPGCPSRRPARRNVCFFETAQAALAAGFRSCLRCRPLDVLESPVDDSVARACRLIEASEAPPSLNELAAAVGLSPGYLHRRFKAGMGMTPKAYGAALKIRRLASALSSGVKVSDAIYAAGYAASSRAYEAAAGGLGMAPSVYRRGGEGESIRYAVAACSLGWLAVAATGRGVVAIELSDDADALREALGRRFPKARLVEASTALGCWLDAVVAHIEAPGALLDLPLDVRGTAFQLRVWRELQAIPAGTTISYATLARRLGRPQAVRAVAGACAANPLAVVIPCHRVVAADGKLRGYHWGLTRKARLLAREAREDEANGEDELVQILRPPVPPRP